MTLWYLIDKSVRSISIFSSSDTGNNVTDAATTKKKKPTRQNNTEQPPPPYSVICSTLNADTTHSLLGEIQTVLVQAIALLLPCGFVLLIMMTLYYIRMKDRGMPGQGTDGDLATVRTDNTCAQRA